MAEVFKQTHTLKANKEKFADKRSSDIWLNCIRANDKNRIFSIGGFLASTLRTYVFAPQASSVSFTSPAPASQEEAVDLREQVHLLNQNIQDMARQLHESEERYQALHDELSRRPSVLDPEVEVLKEQLRQELRLIQEHRRQMDVAGEQMHAGASYAAHDLPLPPPPPPAPRDNDDANYVDP
ncbi:hypothetical protein PIB30_059842 [Stylosanthes scabra]|uniref:Uncharacterized protein n=1 Tax=Stylosanthes scabra TaxID=79078 RepID=A0ABU6XIN1_9FABA|nr:hypothetical protein [Stylosanthes scabra]